MEGKAINDGSCSAVRHCPASGAEIEDKEERERGRRDDQLGSIIKVCGERLLGSEAARGLAPALHDTPGRSGTAMRHSDDGRGGLSLPSHKRPFDARVDSNLCVCYCPNDITRSQVGHPIFHDSSSRTNAYNSRDIHISQGIRQRRGRNYIHAL